jgi:hypothetical protein
LDISPRGRGSAGAAVRLAARRQPGRSAVDVGLRRPAVPGADSGDGSPPLPLTMSPPGPSDPTLGAYSKDAQNLGRTRQDLRLVNGNELVALIFEH